MSISVGWPSWYNLTDGAEARATLDRYHFAYEPILENDVDLFDAIQLADGAKEWTENLNKAWAARDRSQFFLSPTIVNAFYFFFTNSIVIPYAILTRPFYR